MAAFHVRVPAMVHFLLLVAASTAVLALPAINEGSGGAVQMDPKVGQRAFPVDYRYSKCMPPIPEEFILGTSACVLTYWALPAVSMVEYLDCESSPKKVLRDFRSWNVRCPLCILPNFKRVTDALDYLIYAGIALNTTYYEAQGEEETCHANQVEIAYRLKKGYRNLKPFDEANMAKEIRKNGPVLATLYVDLTKSGEAENYTAGIFDSDSICPSTVAGYSYDIAEAGLTKGVAYPVMVVGYGRLDEVNVWILRSEWVGPTWGLGGYFYLKRGINACGIAVSPIRVLG